jgi:NAD(P)-dependent dehydrogenase (short-subunit alcohol dehydrogenase family)
VIANVEVTEEHAIIGSPKHDPDVWWSTMATNLRSAHLTAHHCIQAFHSDEKPTGTFIALASYAGTQVVSGLSSYGIAKQATNRLVEFLDVEYPELRAFALDPGIVKHVAIMPEFVPYALDTTDLVGAFSIWLASDKADALKDSFLHTTWDVEELEARAEEIRDKRLLKSNFLGGILGSGQYLGHNSK